MVSMLVEMLTMRPQLRAIRCGVSVWAIWNNPLTLTSTDCDQSNGSPFQNG